MRWFELVVAFVVASAGAACGSGESPNQRAQSPSSSDDSADDDSNDDGDPVDASTAGHDAGPRMTKDAASAKEVDAAIAPAKDSGSSDAKDASTSGRAPDAEQPSSAGGPVGAASQESVTVGTMPRTFLLYIPNSLSGQTAPAPLVSVHHGFAMSGKIMEDMTTWKAIAERERFVVAFPDGGDISPWNVGDGVCNVGAFVAAPSDQDDLGFVKAIIEAADKKQPIDKSKVFVGGFSMGGYFANNVGCKGRDFARAAAAHSGGTYSGDCPGDPIPMLVIHGDSDGLIPYQCGKEAYGYWVERNGCSSDADMESVKGGSCVWNKGCPENRDVGLCTMPGMDHGWAGAPSSGPGGWLTAPVEYAADGDMTGFGGGTQYEDAAELMWKFFASHM